MLKLPSLTGLEGLLNLDRQGVDIRPTLLRVITDQYLQTPVHTADEERQFTELALRLIDETDIPTRAAVSTRLARHPTAPRAILQQLARDVLEVAEPILRHSPGLNSEDLKAIADERGPSYAEIIAARAAAAAAGTAAVAASTAAPASVSATVPPSTPAPAFTSAASPAAVLLPPKPKAPPAIGPNDVNVTVEAWELCELFFSADAEERRLILTALDYGSGTPEHPPSALQRSEIWRLESAALQHNMEAVVRELERGLHISPRLARRIAADELGEPVVVAAKALALPADVLQRMLLFMNPRVGQSVDRVYELATLYEQITVEAARRLIDIWQDADPAHPVTHAAQWQKTVERARAALTDMARRAPLRPEAPATPAPRRSADGPTSGPTRESA